MDLPEAVQHVCERDMRVASRAHSPAKNELVKWPLPLPLGTNVSTSTCLLISKFHHITISLNNHHCRRAYYIYNPCSLADLLLGVSFPHEASKDWTPVGKHRPLLLPIAMQIRRSDDILLAS